VLGTLPNKRMQLAARGLRITPVPIRRLGLRSARRAQLRNEPPAGVRWVHGGRQLMRKPLASEEWRRENYRDSHPAVAPLPPLRSRVASLLSDLRKCSDEHSLRHPQRP
jgi:hypothetical protein